MRKILFLTTFCFFLSTNLFAQQIISGTIKDSDETLLPNVIIGVKGSEYKTFSTENGKFIITVPKGSKTLTFHLTGYDVQEVEVNNDEINIVMSKTAEVFDLTLKELMNIKVFSVSKKSEIGIEAPQSLIIITEQDIINRGYTDIEQILHDLPGFNISRGNGVQYSNIYQRGYRSNNNDRILFLVDGVEENDIWKGAAWISRQYPLSNIKQIEVIYGPSSTIYGANAFLGVINIVTKDNSEIVKGDNKIGVNANVGYGSYNTRFSDITLALKQKSISFSLTGKYFFSDEHDLGKYDGWKYDYIEKFSFDDYIRELETTDTVLINQAMELDKAGYYSVNPKYSNTTSDWLVYGKMQISDFTFGFQTWNRKEGTGAWYLDYRLGPEHGSNWTPSNTFIYTKYDKSIGSKFNITLFSQYKLHILDPQSERGLFNGYINKYSVDDLTDSEGARIPKWSYDWTIVNSNQLRNELKTVFSHKEKFDLVTGVELRLGEIQYDYIRSKEENPGETGELKSDVLGGSHLFNRDFGFYSQATFRFINNLSFVLGGRADNNKIRETGGYGTVFNTRAAIVFTYLDFVLKTIYSEAFKDADNWAKYSTTSARLLNNPFLQPEKVKNIEFSAGYKLTANMYLEALAYKAFYSDVVGTVKVITEDGIETTQNQGIGTIEIQGIQASLNYTISKFSMYMNYTFTDPKNTKENIRLGDIANHHINGGVNARFFKKLNINLRANYSGRKETGENTSIGDNPYNEIDAFFLLNSTVTYQNLVKGLSLQLIGNNLLNSEYYHPGVRSADGEKYAARIPQPMFNYMIKIMYKF